MSSKNPSEIFTSSSSNRQPYPTLDVDCGNESARSGSIASSTPRSYPKLSFVHINNPAEEKWRSKRRAVRSHVAYYQHHKNDETDLSLRPSNREQTRRTSNSRTKSPTKQGQPKRVFPGKTEFPIQTHSGFQSRESWQGVLFKDNESRQNPQRNLLKPDCLFRGTRVDPFRSYPIPWREEYAPIVDYYTYEICNDIPSIHQHGKFLPLRSVWFPFVLQSPKAFYAAICTGGAIYHFHKGDLSSRPPALFALRMKAIAAINESLADHKRGFDVFDVLAVFHMTCMESLYGDAAAYNIHMAGLARMLKIRGGLRDLPLDDLVTSMIVWLDISHARSHHSTLHFAESVEVAKRQFPLSKEFASPPHGAGVSIGGSASLEELQQFTQAIGVQLLSWRRIIEWLRQGSHQRASEGALDTAVRCAESVS